MFIYGHILISIKNITHIIHIIFLAIVEVCESLLSTIVLSASHPLSGIIFFESWKQNLADNNHVEGGQSIVSLTQLS